MNKMHDSSVSGFISNDCEYINNTASKYGGVIYSLGENNRIHTEFNNCIFNNNHAKLGDIVYSYSINSIPVLKSNDKEISFDTNDIITLPTYFELDPNTIDKVSILSGENIPEGITCK